MESDVNKSVVKGEKSPRCGCWLDWDGPLALCSGFGFTEQVGGAGEVVGRS